jgi:hypothetical protein
MERKWIMSNPMKDRAKDVIDTAADQANTAVTEKLETVAHAMADSAGQVGERARHDADHAQRLAGEAYDATAQAVRDVGQELTSLVRRYPIPALLVGFGMGFVMSRALRA